MNNSNVTCQIASFFFKTFENHKICQIIMWKPPPHPLLHLDHNHPASMSPVGQCLPTRPLCAVGWLWWCETIFLLFQKGGTVSDVKLCSHHTGPLSSIITHHLRSKVAQPVLWVCRNSEVAGAELAANLFYLELDWMAKIREERNRTLR